MVLSRNLKLALLAPLLSGAVLWATPSPVSAQTPEQIYAELAKLPPAERQARLEAGARKEGRLVAMTNGRGRMFADQVTMFMKRYPFIKLDAAEMQDGDKVERFLNEEQIKTYTSDIVGVSLPDMKILDDRGYLAAYPTPATAKVLPAYKSFLHQQNRWVPNYWSERGITYNTEMLKPAEAPRDWWDLCDARFKGQVGIEPLEASFLVGIYEMMGEEKSKQWLQCLGRNNPLVQKGHEPRMQLMLLGDHSVEAGSFLFTGYTTYKKDPQRVPFGISWTTEIFARGGGVAINKRTPHPHAAALYADWTLSDEYQNYWYDAWRGPVTRPHPFIPDSAKLFVSHGVGEDIRDKMLQYWNEYMRKR